MEILIKIDYPIKYRNGAKKGGVPDKYKNRENVLGKYLLCHKKKSALQFVRCVAYIKYAYYDQTLEEMDYD